MKTKNPIPENKIDELKALIARSILIKIEQKKIEEKLPESLFLKIHRSYIINLKKIVDIEDNSVLIKKDVIPVSRSKRPELMKRLDLL